MATRTLLGVAALAGCIAGGEARLTETDVPSSFGLKQSAVGRSALAEAIASVNGVLTGGERRLFSGWVHGPGSAPDRSDVVPVYLVLPDGLPYRSPAQVPDGVSAIFVAADWSEQTADLLGQGFGGPYPVHPSDLLAVILLHELGHIVSDAGSPASGVLGADSRAKREELRADENVVKRLRSSENESPARAELAGRLRRAVFDAGENVAFAYNWRYGLHGSPLSWMIRPEPMLEYTDHDERHPNLTLRFLRIASLLDPTPERVRRLQWRLKRRDEGVTRRVRREIASEGDGAQNAAGDGGG